MNDFVVVASSSAEHLSMLEKRGALLGAPVLAVTVEGGSAWAQGVTEENACAPYLFVLRGARFLAAVAQTDHLALFTEDAAYACARYGKKMYRFAPQRLPYAVLDGKKKRLFFSSVYVEEKAGAVWIASRSFLLDTPTYASFGMLKLR